MIRPYATHTDVALFHRTLTQGSGFSANSTLTDTTIDSMIELASSSVEMQFRSAGYIIPFQALASGWPDFQTDYLKLVVALGTSSFMYPSLKPSPAMSSGNSQSATSTFRDLFHDEMKRIYDHKTGVSQIRFEAKYLIGTPAEKAVLEPSIPVFNNLTDSERLQTLNEWTRLEIKLTSWWGNYA